MQGFRFYAEMPQARKSKSASKANPFFPWTVKGLTEKAGAGFECDVIALHIAHDGTPFYCGYNMDCISVAIEGNALSYCSTGASRDYLAKRATRVPESLARKLAPQLFKKLEP